MELQEAVHLLQLPDAEAGPLTADSLRRQYLKLALRTHPDKNPNDAGAAERFQRLGAAYNQVLETLHHDAALLQEKQRAAALLELLLRAFKGEEVEHELCALGEYRPPAAFGVDLTLPFDKRVPRAPAGSCIMEQPDVKQAFMAAFQEQGLTEDGDPVDGYAIKPGEEIWA